MTFFVVRGITGLSDCCFARAKTVSRLNMPCATFRSLSVFPIMNWDRPYLRISVAVCPRLKKLRKSWRQNEEHLRCCIERMFLQVSQGQQKKTLKKNVNLPDFCCKFAPDFGNSGASKDSISFKVSVNFNK